MDKKYNPAEIEPKWQEVWEREKLYQTPDRPEKKKYVLDMFPYPSGAGLHVGHIEGYTGTDIISRFLRMNGHGVLHPMGWDAFGLPAENYAIKKGIEPNKSTHDNIANFKEQINRAGLSYDWDREIDSSSPNYYKYTQWIFIQLFKNGLAYKKKAPANWCPKDETVLANEQVIDGKCERCGSEVIQKDLEQWFFKITDYADRLIDGLMYIDWPKSTKMQQENWIGRKEGANIKFGDISVFTTRPDTIFGATALVLAPEHEVSKKLALENKKVSDYISSVKNETQIQRESLNKEKTGIDTGLKVVNPANGEEIAVWISDYVLSGTGTGAIMAVPYLDERDRQFALKFNLPIKEIEVDPSIFGKLVEKGVASKQVNYHLRDWLVSRQRYWGAPIPMIVCEKCGWQPVPEENLPVLLPTDVDFQPHGESPIARSESFQKDVVCPKCGGSAKREVDTMDTFVDSSWYFWAFTFANKELMRDSKLEKKGAENVFSEFREEIKTWTPVDFYVGGAEHTVLHLMYSRFFWKAFMDFGFFDKSLGEEPFLKLRHPGTVLGEDSRKMSKRWGNVINPTDVANQYGADTLRVYEMFMGPFDATKPWNTKSVAGVHRFLTKIFKLFNESDMEVPATEESNRALNKLISKVTADISELHFNTCVSSMMEFMNFVQEEKNIGKDVWMKFLLVLAPFAPYLTEELYQTMSEKSRGKNEKFESIHKQSWPVIDNKYLVDSKAKVAVSINGKTRGVLEIEGGISQEKIVEKAKLDEKICKYLDNTEIKKVVYVPGKILNFVV